MVDILILCATILHMRSKCCTTASAFDQNGMCGIQLRGHDSITSHAAACAVRNMVSDSKAKSEDDAVAYTAHFTWYMFFSCLVASAGAVMPACSLACTAIMRNHLQTQRIVCNRIYVMRCLHIAGGSLFGWCDAA